jgi:hypothetical protein
LPGLRERLRGLRVLATGRSLAIDHTQAKAAGSRPVVSDVCSNACTDSGYLHDLVRNGFVSRSQFLSEPIYEMGSSAPVAYIRGTPLYECRHCGDYLERPPEGERLYHRCPDGTIEDRLPLVNVEPVSVEEATAAVESMLGILEETDE